MDTEQKQMIQQMRQNGHSYLEIAVALDVSINTIKSYYRRINLNTDTDNIKPEDDCKECGKPLKHGIKGQPKKFCSEDCRRIWWKANDNELAKKAYYTITCKECKEKFESYGNKNRKFCGHACYIKNRFQKGVVGSDKCTV